MVLKSVAFIQSFVFEGLGGTPSGREFGPRLLFLTLFLQYFT